MRRGWAALLLAVAAAASYAAEPETGAPPPSPVVQQEQALQQAAEWAPAALREALQALLDTPADEPQASTRSRLTALLQHSTQPELRPDAAFAAVQDLLAPEDEAVQARYAEALADHLVDPRAHCRQPIYGRYFRQRYPRTAPPLPCRQEVPFVVLSRYGEPQVVKVDPARVHAIHLLYAGRNAALASRFGHVALRLVICPQDTDDAEACTLNLQQHLVLGYRAHVDELALSFRKALTGGYQTRLYAQPFLDVYQEYAIDEFRSMEALPLTLEPAQRETMVRELAELHFRAAGPYRYFTRNCATLLQDALRVLWRDYAALDHASFLRPDRFFAAMRAIPLADGERLSDARRAEYEGLLFPSTQPYYEQAATVVAAAMQAPHFATLEEFLQLSPRGRRERREADSAFMRQLQQDRHVRQAQLLLEEYAMMRSERMVMAALGQYVADHGVEALVGRARRAVPPTAQALFDDCFAGPVLHRAQPLFTADGIPDSLATSALPRAPSHCHSQEAAAAMSEAFARFFEDADEAAVRIRALADYHLQSLDNVQALQFLEQAQALSSRQH